MKLHKFKSRELARSVQPCIKICLLCAVAVFIFSVFKVFISWDTKLSKEAVQLLHSNSHDIKYNSTKGEELLEELKLTLQNTNHLKNDVTVVTAYFNIGYFKKGDQGYYTEALYRKWVTLFKYIENPVVAYFDSAEFCEYFKALRSRLPPNMTRAVLVGRGDLWAFRIRDKINAIFQQPGYPKHNPNTVLPEYSCIMHSKYELMKRTVIENVYKTKYFSWLDVGLFRDMVDRKDLSPFGIYLPENMLDDSVAYAEVKERERRLTAVDVIYGNYVWVCGCFFIAKADVMLRWTVEYMEGVEWLMRRKLMNTDQQVIYILTNARLARTPIQTYRADGLYNKWFHLGYMARDAWLNRKIE